MSGPSSNCGSEELVAEVAAVGGGRSKMVAVYVVGGFCVDALGPATLGACLVGAVADVFASAALLAGARLFANAV